MAEAHIVVVGAGVSGLTTALLLSQNPAYRITVAAKYMPGDYDIEYASPWAGANYLPVSAAGTAAAEHDRNTWPELARLARDCPEAGVHFQDTIIYAHASDTANELCKPDPWFAAILPNFHLLPPHLHPGYDHATAFTSVCINTSIYLPWLLSRCVAAGVQFRRAVFAHIADAAHLPASSSSSSFSPSEHQSSTLPTVADVIVNCTGLASRHLGGVADAGLQPVRGQTVLVRNAAGGVMAGTGRTADGEAEMCYVMQRAVGGGTLLGGCAQPGNWDPTVDPNLAVRIMQRAVALCPALVTGERSEAGGRGERSERSEHGERDEQSKVINHGEMNGRTERAEIAGQGRQGKAGEQDRAGAQGTAMGGQGTEAAAHKRDISRLSIIRHQVGLRPVRAGGVRLAKERIAGVWTVHNYGHGGYGYQASYGCAGVAVGLVREVLAGLKGKGGKGEGKGKGKGGRARL